MDIEKLKVELEKNLTDRQGGKEDKCTACPDNCSSGCSYGCPENCSAGCPVDCASGCASTGCSSTCYAPGENIRESKR